MAVAMKQGRHAPSTVHLGSLLRFHQNELQHYHGGTTFATGFWLAHPPGLVAMCPQGNVRMFHLSVARVEDEMWTANPNPNTNCESYLMRWGTACGFSADQVCTFWRLSLPSLENVASSVNRTRDRKSFQHVAWQPPAELRPWRIVNIS